MGGITLPPTIKSTLPWVGGIVNDGTWNLVNPDFETIPYQKLFGYINVFNLYIYYVLYIYICINAVPITIIIIIIIIIKYVNIYITCIYLYIYIISSACQYYPMICPRFFATWKPFLAFRLLQWKALVDLHLQPRRPWALGIQWPHLRSRRPKKNGEMDHHGSP